MNERFLKDLSRKVLHCLCGLLLFGELVSCTASQSDDNYPVREIPSSLSEGVKNYNQVREFHDGLAIVERDNRYGFIDSLGNEMVACKYIGLSYNAPGYYTTYVSDPYHKSGQGLIGRDGKRLTEDVYGNIVYMPDFKLICCYGENVKERFFNIEGVEINPAFYNREAIQKAQKYGEYDKSTPFYNDLSLVTYYDRPSKTYYKKFINTKGEIVMDVTEKNGKYGVVDTQGREIVPHKYESIEDYDDGYLLVSDGVNRYGLWDLKNGKETLLPQYNVFGMFGKTFNPVHTFLADGLLRVTRERGRELIDPSNGNVIISQETGGSFFDILPNGTIIVTFPDNEGQSYAIYNFEGKEIIGKHDFIEGSSEGFMARDRIEKNDTRLRQEGAFSLEGKTIIPIENDRCLPPSEGLTAVKKSEDGKFGFVNSKGKYVIEPFYDEAGYFSEGLAPVKLNGKWGFVNRKGDDTFGTAKTESNE